MKIQKIFNFDMSYLIKGCTVGAIALVLFIVGYFVIYKLAMKGEKKIRPFRVVWLCIFLAMMYIIVGYNIKSTHTIPEKGGVVDFLYLYKLAWNSFNAEQWKHIIMNYVLFIPVGLWISLGLVRFRNFFYMVLSGLGLSICVQMLQLFSSRNVFELDDLLGNTVGTVIGYGLAAVLFHFYNMVRKKQKFDYTRVLLLQVPLVLTLSCWGMMMLFYNLQEKGNNPYEAVAPQDKNHFEVVISKTLSDEKSNLLTYEKKKYTAEEAEEFGKEIFKKLGAEIDEEKTVVTDNNITLYSKEGKQYSLAIDFDGGTYQFYDFEESIKDISVKKKKGADEETIREALKKYGVTVPEEAEFMELDDGHYQFKTDKIENEEGMLNGALICDYHGKGKFSSIHYSICNWKPYNDYPAKSEAEAFHEIEKGMFIYNGQEKDKLKIKVKNCSTTYILDTKGYYQPVYVFDCEINGKDDSLVIPAY
ncbi:MAG: VanZ family protein [Lachnospiraceae bacterium]|nr:VanZ family protein [Lachnospiraceae bacterium]